MIVDFEDNQLWVNFRYEHLHLFCYSYVKMGHFTTNCSKVSYSEAEKKEERAENFGYWLKAEVYKRSLFWNLFYGEDHPKEDEVILETQNQDVN